MTTPTRVTGTRAFSADVEQLLSVADDTLETLRERIAESESVFLDFSELSRLATGLGLSDSDLGTIYAFQTNLARLDVERRASFARDIEDYLPDGVSVEQFQSRLDLLGFDAPGVRRAGKRARLQRTAERSLTGIKILTDIRPVFDAERDSIEGLAELATLRLTYTDDRDESHCLHIGLDRDDLEDLAEEASNALQKLGIIEEFITAAHARLDR